MTGFTIDMRDPEAARFVWLASVRGRLRIEIAGLSFRGRPILKIINETEGTNFKRKAAALEFIEAEMTKIQEARHG